MALVVDVVVKYFYSYSYSQFSQYWHHWYWEHWAHEVVHGKIEGTADSNKSFLGWTVNPSPRFRSSTESKQDGSKCSEHKTE